MSDITCRQLLAFLGAATAAAAFDPAGLVLCPRGGDNSGASAGPPRPAVVAIAQRRKR